MAPERTLLAPERRLALFLLFSTGCASSPGPTSSLCPEPPQDRQASRAAPRPASEAEIKSLSDQVLLAFDRGDISAFEANLTDDFVHFDGGTSSTRQEELERLSQRRPGVMFFSKRTWTDERVFVFPDHALFVGKATETQGGNEVHDGGYQFLGWHTLQWVPDAEAWKLRYWTWQRASESGQRDVWNEIYRNGVGFKKEPNQLLIEAVRGKEPGTALDLTVGQGRNALFLAAQGWKVTGVDLSDEGLRIARAEAAKLGLSVAMIEANIDTWDFGKERWDLVTMIYAGAQDAWLTKARQSLRRGGWFVLEAFAFDPERGQSDGIKPGELAKVFADFEIVRDERVEDVPDWDRNRALLQRFVAKKR
ncbi:MAG: methyltransferase domain-containing protein [Deltaproteobacteria bacterium]|nr:methyltransferase domain-containing protein [Deltaproteobacteria bacterium]